MTRHGARRPPPIDDRDLAAEVLYLHSLCRRGPAAPAPVPVPVPAATPNQFRSGRRRPRRRKRRRSGRGSGDSEDAGPDSPRAPFPPPSPDASASASPEESTPPPPAPVRVPAATDPHSRPGRRRPRRRKRRRSGPGNADSEDAVGDSPHAPSPPASPDAPSSPWPNAHDCADGPTSSKPLPPPPSPGSLAHREALRAAADFFTSHGSDGEEEDDDVSESEGDEEEAAEFYTGMFERDAELRGHYERGWEEGQFACMACAGTRRARRGRARRFRGCVSLVQHARSATRFGRSAAHRALAAVVCRVLGWDIGRLPSIVMDPRGTLSQELAARVQSDAQEAKVNVKTEMKGSNTDVDKAANELVTSKESVGMNNDVEENGPLDSVGDSKNKVRSHETIQEADAVKTGMEEPLSIDGEKVATEHNGDKESSEKEDAVKMEEPLSIDGENVATELDGDKESSKKENTEDTCSKYKCKNENCMKTSVQEEVNATVSELEHAKTADGIGDTAVARLGNNPAEENVHQNKDHANSIVKFYEELEGEDLFTS